MQGIGRKPVTFCQSGVYVMVFGTTAVFNDRAAWGRVYRRLGLAMAHSSGVT